MLMPNVIVVVLWYYYAAVPAIKLSGRSEVGRSEGGLRFNLNFETNCNSIKAKIMSADEKIQCNFSKIVTELSSIQTEALSV